MITVHPQYVVDAAQTRTEVLIPAAEWEEILEALEDLDGTSRHTTRQKQKGRAQCPLRRHCVRLSRRVGNEILRSAQKQLAKLDAQTRSRIASAVNALADDPRPPGYKKLTGRPA